MPPAPRLEVCGRTDANVVQRDVAPGLQRLEHRADVRLRTAAARDPRRQNALCTNAAIATPFDSEGCARCCLKRDAREASISPRARRVHDREPDPSAVCGEHPQPIRSSSRAQASGPTTLSSRFEPTSRSVIGRSTDISALDRGEGTVHVEDDPCLVEIQFGEPPQGVLAEQEAGPQPLTIHVCQSQRLDPRVCGACGALFGIGVEVIGRLVPADRLSRCR